MMYLDNFTLNKGGAPVSRVNATRNTVWQSFKKSFEEIKHLEGKLSQTDAQAKKLRAEIEAKKTFLEGITTLKWESIQAVLTGRVSHNSDASQANGPVDQRAGFKEDGTRVWVLKAIAYYEDHNRESHVNARSIRIYINEQSPGFFEGHRDNIIHCALGAMCKKGLIAKVKSKSQHTRQSEYALTPAGRQMINVEMVKGANHG